MSASCGACFRRSRCASRRPVLSLCIVCLARCLVADVAVFDVVSCWLVVCVLRAEIDGTVIQSVPGTTLSRWRDGAGGRGVVWFRYMALLLVVDMHSPRGCASHTATSA